MSSMLTLGGYLTSRRPVSLVREAVRTKQDFDELIVPVGCVESDLAMGLPNLQRYTIGLITLGVWGLAPAVRDRVETGSIEPIEWGVTSVLRSFQAGARLEPSARGRFRPPIFGAPLDQDGLPVTGSLREIPAHRPDVAYLHVPYADPVKGCAWGYGAGIDLIIAAAARKLVISYDIATSEPPHLPNRFVVPSHLVGELVHRPFGGFPTNSFPLYGPCGPFYPRYLKMFDERRDSWRSQELCGDDDRAFIRKYADDDDLARTIDFGPAPNADVVKHRKELMTWLKN